MINDNSKTRETRDTGGMIVLYLCAQLAVLYTYNCLLILIYYRLGPGGIIVLYLVLS